jgi:hypothetical protein
MDVDYYEVLINKQGNLAIGEVFVSSFMELIVKWHVGFKVISYIYYRMLM